MMAYLLSFFILIFFFMHGFYCSSERPNCIIDFNEMDLPKFKVAFHFCTPTKEYCKQFDPKKSNLADFLESREFNPEIKTAVLIHGFLHDTNAEWVTQMKINLMNQMEQMNVILVDWSDAFFSNENPVNYTRAALATKTAALNVNKKLANIVMATKSFFAHLHLIGHSLGAHVAGQTGRFLQESGKTVHRITGLDPAHPCFENSYSPRLRDTDAEFVDVIHTNSEPGKNPNFGTYDPIGHIDFYPNGGNKQPRCYSSREAKTVKVFFEEWIPDVLNFLISRHVHIDVKDIIKNIIVFGNYWSLCDHGEAPKFFTSTLKNRKFLAIKTSLPIPVSNNLKCQNRLCTVNTCVEMGINADRYKNLRGVYYVDTIKSCV